jgi:hypothetical protein
MFRATKFLISVEIKMLKDKTLLSGKDTMDGTRDGESSILIRLEKNLEKDGTETLALT